MKPTAQLTSSNVAATCYYNDTVLEGILYTRMEKNYPLGTGEGGKSTDGGSGGSGGEIFEPWPFAVRIEQVSASGRGTPTCVDNGGDVLGDFSVPNGGEMCDCLYLNSRT